MSNRGHAKLPPSGSKRWINCPPQAAYTEALLKAGIIKKPKPIEAALRGQRVHAWGEQFIKWMILGKDTTKVKGEPSELAEARLYAQHCADMIEDERLISKSIHFGVEDKATLVPGQCWGSRDFWIETNGTLYIIDLKTGIETVEVEDSTQLLIYAIDLFEALKPKRVTLGIWQPNSFDGLPPLRMHTYTADEMRLWADKLRIHVAKSKQYFDMPIRKMEEDLKAGEHCNFFCDARGVCPAERKYQQEFSKAAFMPAKTDRKGVAKAPELREVTTLTPAQLGEIMERAPLFQGWLEAVKAQALITMQKGKTIPGWKAVAKKTHFQFERALTPAKIAAKLKLTVADITETKLLSPSKVKALLPTKRKDLIKPLLWRPYEVTLAKTSDKREAIPSTKISFTPVSTSEEYDDGK